MSCIVDQLAKLCISWTTEAEFDMYRFTDLTPFCKDKIKSSTNDAVSLCFWVLIIIKNRQLEFWKVSLGEGKGGKFLFDSWLSLVDIAARVFLKNMMGLNLIPLIQFISVSVRSAPRCLLQFSLKYSQGVATDLYLTVNLSGNFGCFCCNSIVSGHREHIYYWQWFCNINGLFYIFS